MLCLEHTHFFFFGAWLCLAVSECALFDTPESVRPGGRISGCIERVEDGAVLVHVLGAHGAFSKKKNISANTLSTK